MTAQFPRCFQIIFSTIKKFESGGYRETEYGVRLYGHAPHVAPQAWLHAIPRGLTESEIDDLGLKLGKKIPADYAELMRSMNGAHLFSGAFALYGIRAQKVGRAIDSAFLPFDIFDANQYDRPLGLLESEFVIGGYKYDGSLVIINTSTGRIYRIGRDTGEKLNSWESLEDFLAREMRRLDALHDSAGKLIVSKEKLVPSVGN